MTIEMIPYGMELFRFQDLCKILIDRKLNIMKIQS